MRATSTPKESLVSLNGSPALASPWYHVAPRKTMLMSGWIIAFQSCEAEGLGSSAAL